MGLQDQKNLRWELWISLLLLVTSCLIALRLPFAATGDSGDSIMHYLYARWAPAHPALFFDHWAKPLYVLLSFPFAQYGFTGTMIFNILCAVLTALLTFYTARRLGMAWPLSVFVLFFCAPLYLKMSFSGLTEYLFALVLISAIFFETAGRSALAVVVISFSPLVRSEGLIICGMFGLYHLIKNNYRLIPLLALGQLIYSLTGWLFHKDPLWVLRDIPYASLASPYGRGGPFDMAHRLNYVIEKPIYLLLVTGLAYTLLNITNKKDRPVALLQSLLVAGSFLAFFVLHSFFWWKGLFNSMGLPRVFIAVMPLIVLLALEGLGFLQRLGKYGMFAASALLFVAGIYPFSPRSQGIVYGAGLFGVPENEIIEDMLPQVREKIPALEDKKIYYAHPFISLALDRDWFDERKHGSLREINKPHHPVKGEIVIWDSWYGPVECGISEAQLRENKRLKLLTQAADANISNVRFLVFEALE